MHEIWVGVFRPLKEIYEFAFFYLGTFRTYSNTFLSALSALFPRLLRTFFFRLNLGFASLDGCRAGGWEDRGRRNFLCSVSPAPTTNHFLLNLVGYSPTQLNAFFSSKFSVVLLY